MLHLKSLHLAGALGALIPLIPSTGSAQSIDFELRFQTSGVIARGAAFGACSRIFASGLSPEEAKYRDAGFLRAVGVDDPDEDVSIYPFSDADGGGSVFAAVREFGQIAAWGIAVYQPGHGCTTVVDESLTAVRAARLPAPVYAPNSSLDRWPVGRASGASDVDPALLREVSSAVDPLFPEYQGPTLGTADDLADLRTLSVAVAHGGELIFERYLEDASGPVVHQDTPLIGYSLTKTVLGLAIGAWVTDTMDSRGVPEHERGAWIERFLDTRVPVAEGAFETNSYEELLQMRSDRFWVEPLDAPKLLFGNGDTATAAAFQPRIFHTLNYANYNSSTSVLLSKALQDDIGGKEATLDYLQSNLFAPAHVTSAQLPVDEAGTLQGASSFHMSTRDWLRMGQLFLDNGRVDATEHGDCIDLELCGEEVIAPQWMDFMRRPRPRNPFLDATSAGYGGHVWMRRFEVNGESVQAYVFKGLGTQRIFVVPAYDLVVVRVASDFAGKGSETMATAVANIIAALQ